MDHQNEAALDSRMLVYYELVKTAKVSSPPLVSSLLCAQAQTSPGTHRLDFPVALEKIGAGGAVYQEIVVGMGG